MLHQLLTHFDIVSLISTVVYCSIIFFVLSGLVLSTCFTVNKILDPTRNLYKLGIGSQSHLSDQYDSRYAGSKIPSDERPTVKALYIHPVKSCKPIEVERIRLTKIGFVYDRCFAIASEAKDESSLDWRFISQRTKPQMSQIQTELWLPYARSELLDGEDQSAGRLVVRFPNPEASTVFERLWHFLRTASWSHNPPVQFDVPLFPRSSDIDKYNIQRKGFGIHGRTAQGLDLGTIPTVAAILPKLKTFLRVPQRERLTIFRCTSETLTETAKDHAPISNIGTAAVHGYTDQRPIHFATLSSVQSLSKILPPENQPLNALRFRANMYLVGTSPYVEESWKRYRILPKSFRRGPRSNMAAQISVVCRTSRCTMPNVDPNT